MSKQGNIISQANNLEKQTKIEQSQTNQLLKVQKDILEIVVTGNQYQSALDSLCLAAEGLLERSVASVMLFSSDRSHLNVRAAPSLSGEAIEALNGIEPGENAGSCGTAVYKKEPQFISNTVTDKRWKDFQGFVEQFEVGACWSMPIRNSNDVVVGSFALSSFEEREPLDFHQLILETAAKLASIIVTREIEEEKLHKAASYDSLTGLANRATLYERLNLAIERCNRHDRQLAVLFIDLDNFKEVNDKFGHELGDYILKKVAERMSLAVRVNDSLARLGGDEFVLVIEEYHRLSEVCLVAEKVLESFEGLTINNEKSNISASIGISVYPHDAVDVENLLFFADKAMYSSKRKGKNKFDFYQEGVAKRSTSNDLFLKDLKKAVVNGDIKGYLQPVYDLTNGSIVSAEILARWRHPIKGLISPSDFIPKLEKLNLLNRVTESVIEEAIIQAKQTWPEFIDRILLSFNINLSQLTTELTGSIRKVISRHRYPASSLAVEISESDTHQISGAHIEELMALRELGVNLVLDNFGKTKTELTSLSKLPINTIKIDPSVIRNISEHPEYANCTKNIISLGNSLGAKVIASGVENEVQRDYLLKHQCQEAQGFNLGRPVTTDSFHQLLKVV